MIEKSGKRFHLPFFADPETERIARILRTLLLALVAGGLLIAGNRLFNGYATVGFVVLAAVGVGLFSFWLLYQGRVQLAAFLTLLALLVAITSLLFIGLGIHDIAIILYPGVIMVGGMLLTRRAFILYMLAILLSVGMVVLSELQGWIQTPLNPTVNDFLIVSIILGITAVSTRILTGNLSQSLIRSRHQEKALARAKRRLEEHAADLRASEEESRRFQEALQALHEVSIELSRSKTPESFYRRAVLLGRTRLGFERLSLLLYDKEQEMMVGTFGTDEQGQLRDERNFTQKVDNPEIIDILHTQKRVGFWEGTPLLDRGRVIGHGWKALAVLWNGDEGIGWLATDNFIKQKPLRSYQLELLTLYGATLGHLLHRMQTEQALRESQRRLALHVQNTPIGVVEWTPGLVVREWNPAATEIFGYTRAEAVGQHAFDLILPPELKSQISRLWQELIENRGGIYSTNENLTKDGRQIVCKWYNTILVNEDEKVIGVASMVQDVTERKRIEAERKELIAELENKNAELERFTYTVSHDLKSPLVTIRGFLGFLERDLADLRLDRMAKDLAQIRNASDKMHQLLNELLELSRIGRLTNPPQTLPFADLVAEARQLVSGALLQQPLKINVQADLPLIYGDRARLVEVLQNLLDNAVKFMGEQPDPQIDVGAIDGPDDPVFFVRDNGVGIDPRFHDKIFELFDRLDPTVAGTGVGLALVKRIIEVHNGRIWVESTGRANEGSTFYFTLPAPPTDK